MKQLDLILENIRLSHIEKILLESGTQMEAQRGIDLINESIYTVGSMAGSLMEEFNFFGLFEKDKQFEIKIADTAHQEIQKIIGDLYVTYGGKLSNIMDLFKHPRYALLIFKNKILVGSFIFTPLTETAWIINAWIISPNNPDIHQEVIKFAKKEKIYLEIIPNKSGPTDINFFKSLGFVPSTNQNYYIFIP
jgi:hypothetical protein